MRAPIIAAIVAAMAFGGTAAKAQRVGPQSWAPPAPRGQPMPPPAPAPQMPMPSPGQWSGNGPRPQPMPAPPARPGNPGGWSGQNNGQWNGARSRWGGRVGGYWWAGAQAPGGWNGYTRFKRGKRLPGYWVSPGFVIGDWQTYGLMAPPAGYYWTRYYNDALLIDGNGMVFDGVYGLNWDQYGYAYDDSGSYPPQPGYGAGYPAPVYGGTTTYTYESSGPAYAPPPPPPGPMAGGYRGGVIYAAPGSTTTIVVPGPVVTTTTTTEYIEEYSVPAPRVVKRVWRTPAKKWRPRPKPRCCTCACR